MGSGFGEGGTSGRPHAVRVEAVRVGGFGGRPADPRQCARSTRTVLRAMWSTFWAAPFEQARVAGGQRVDADEVRMVAQRRHRDAPDAQVRAGPRVALQYRQHVPPWRC